MRLNFFQTFLIANLISGLTLTTPVITPAQIPNSRIFIAQETKELDEKMIRQAMEVIDQAENG